MSGSLIATHTLTLAGAARPVEVRVNRRARRMTLRLDKQGDGLRLTLPPGVPVADGLTFVTRQEAWLSRRLATRPARVDFADGAAIPILGAPHIIRHRPDARRGTWRAEGELHVSGAAEHLPRRVQDFLKAEARREIVPRAHALADQVGKPIGRITLRDTQSRWGSCSARGHLNFCWRLVMAPEAVLQYVVAHEVAHLVHMNHGARFWRLCAELHPDMETPRRWLRAHGETLQRYG
jgi:predicted metal-dependent hydrolase